MHISEACYKAIQKVIANPEEITSSPAHLAIRKEYFDKLMIEFAPCMVIHIRQMEVKINELEKENDERTTEALLTETANRAIRETAQDLE